MAIFPSYFFLGNIGQENVFYVILERKNAFLGCKKICFTICYNEKTPFYAVKTRSSKSRKIAIFLKGLTHSFRPKIAIFQLFFFRGLTHGFGPKVAIFPSYFFLGNIGQENVFYVILERKNTFLGCKNKKLKKSKNCHFSKGVNPWLRSKVAIFPTFIYAI